MTVEPSAPVEQQAPVAVPAQAPAAAAPEPEKPAEPSFAKHFTALTRKEQALQREREALKAEKAAFEAERAKLAPPPAKPKSPLDLLDPETTPDKLAQATKAELEAIRREWEAQQKKAAEEAQAQAQAQAAETIAAFKNEIVDYVKSNVESCELIALNNAHQLVYDVVEQHFEEKKAVLTIKEAAELVESYLEKQIKDMLAKSKKLKSAVEPPPAAEQKPNPVPSAPNRTLNNGLTSQTPTFVHKSSVQDDAFARAMKALG
jgi:DNA-binding protein H-NS